MGVPKSMEKEAVRGQRKPAVTSPPSFAPVEIPALGGIRFDLDNRLFVTQSEHEHHFITMEGEVDCELMIVDRDGDGNPVTSAEELIAAVSMNGGTWRELRPKKLGRFPARVFDIQRPTAQFYPSLMAVGAVEEEDGWSAPRAARLWISQTDRGLVMISAEAFECPHELPPVVTTGEVIVSTLEFIDTTIDLT